MLQTCAMFLFSISLIPYKVLLIINKQYNKFFCIRSKTSSTGQLQILIVLFRALETFARAIQTRDLHRTYFIRWINARYEVSCPTTLPRHWRYHALGITDAKRELALRGAKIKRPLFELRYTKLNSWYLNVRHSKFWVSLTFVRLI